MPAQAHTRTRAEAEPNILRSLRTDLSRSTKIADTRYILRSETALDSDEHFLVVTPLFRRKQLQMIANAMNMSRIALASQSFPEITPYSKPRSPAPGPPHPWPLSALIFSLHHTPSPNPSPPHPPPSTCTPPISSPQYPSDALPHQTPQPRLHAQLPAAPRAQCIRSRAASTFAPAHAHFRRPVSNNALPPKSSRAVVEASLRLAVAEIKITELNASQAHSSPHPPTVMQARSAARLRPR
eukprot:3089853-Pleurochrysis_carterae.AAC.2